MIPPDIEEALAALDAELGPSAKVRLASAQGRPDRPARAPRVNWKAVAQWCRDNPGLGFSATVHKNAIMRLRATHPDLRVEGTDHRRHPETGKQVATLFMIYEPTEEDEVGPPPVIKRGVNTGPKPVRVQPGERIRKPDA